MQDERGSNTTSEQKVANPQRRAALKAAVRLGVGVGLAPALALAQTDLSTARPQAGDWLVKVDDASSTPIGTEDIPLGAADDGMGGRPGEQDRAERFAPQPAPAAPTRPCDA